MRILDLDLDFFLDHRPHFSPAGRPALTASAPWSETRVRAFLEQHCGLDRHAPLPGRTVTEHHEVFLDWRARIHGGRLTPPFSVVHVDWHADLGMGESTPGYVLTTVLKRPVAHRRALLDAHPARLTPGNFLLFALANRWIDQLTYVYNPARRDMDVPIYCMQDGDFASGALRLPHHRSGTPLAAIIAMTTAPIAWEPPVPFALVSGSDLRTDQPFTHLYLTQSPHYTPPEADRLMAIVQEYMADHADSSGRTPPR